jgi:hypothetical protein
MRDLKELLGPLADQEMPDRWDAIQRREPSKAPEPRRRSRIPVYAVSVAAAVLVLLIVARLAPLGGGGGTAREPVAAQPPQWLVQLAYEQAYQNGDLTPTSSEWVLSDADAIAPAVGLQSGDPSVEEYLVLLHGQFTAYMAPIPSGASAPTGHVLSFAVDARTHRITDWGVSDKAADVAGLAPFLLPDVAETYSDPSGWTVPVPPRWSVQPFDLSKDPSKPIGGALIGTPGTALTPVGPPNALPQASGIGFPSDGVALAVATTVPNWGGEKTYEPPLSVDDMVQGSAPSNAPSMSELTFTGPGGWYTMTLKVGPQASAIDVAAAASMVEALTFSGLSNTPTSTPSTPAAASLPSVGSVVDGRFVVPVALDDGKLRVDVAPSDLQPTIPLTTAKTEAFADPVFQGQNDVVFGFGLVTNTVSGPGVQTVESMPAWIGFGWGGYYNCPATIGPYKHHLPSSGYVAVVIPARQGGTPFDYRAKTSACGYAPTGPSVDQARQTVSIPWTQVGPLDGTTVTVRYAVSSCGTKPTFTAGGRRGTYTLSVLTTLPDAAENCASPVPSTSTFELAPTPGPGTPTFDIVKLLHGPLGPVAQANP